MEKGVPWIIIPLACIGAIAIIGAAVWGGLYLAFRNLDGADCTDTEQKTLSSPNGGHTVKSIYRECGGPSSYFVYLSTGNPNKGYEYTPIAEIENVVQG
jgi:hypothetical protein